MIKSFKDYHKENNPGNYAAINVEKLPDFDLSSFQGQINTEPHITLIYSKDSAVPLDRIQKILDNHHLSGQEVEIIDVKIFDALDKGESTGCVVLGVHSPELNKVHQDLLSVGCQHSYPKFEAHATMIYDASLDDCKKIKEMLTASVVGQKLKLTDYKNNVIKKDWAKSLSK